MKNIWCESQGGSHAQVQYIVLVTKMELSRYRFMFLNMVQPVLRIPAAIPVMVIIKARSIFA